MTNLEIGEVNREGELLIRSCRVKINSDKIVTPAKTIGTTLSGSVEVPFVQLNPDLQHKTFGEIFVRITEDDLRRAMQEKNTGEKFCNTLTNRVSKMRQIHAVPYILFSIVDTGGHPLNQLLSNDLFNFIYDVLWGVQGNAIISMPLLGVLRESKEYNKLIDGFHKRQMDSIDRKNQPLMAIIPSSYTLISKDLLKNYWEADCRIFGYDCENKKFGAHSHIIERIHSTLSEYSKRDEETYILNALNSKFKVGREDNSRINNLIATGYGFDIYSPNHIRAYPNKNEKVERFIFKNTNYGFANIDKLEAEKNVEEIINTRAFKPIGDLSDLSKMNDYQKQKISKQHDLEKVLLEIRQYQRYIEDNKLVDYLTQKEKISLENNEIKSFRIGTVSSDISGWLK
jgi:hypothetical protein